MFDQSHICEVCGGKDFWQYNYPVRVAPFRWHIWSGAVRRCFVNPIKFFFRSVINIIPKAFSKEFIQRARSPYKPLLSFAEINGSIRGIKRGMNLFSGKKILICKNCDLGNVFPLIPEAKLVEHYKKDYWISHVGEIESAENRRTITTYKLLSNYLDFKELDEVLEFGSASAQLSRYFKSNQNELIFDSVDPGIAWKDALKDDIRNIFMDIGMVNHKYSLIMSSHALEHVSSLEKYFEKFVSLLKPGGYLYFEVPNSEERDLIFGSKSSRHFPHTYFFTQKSFDRIAKKYNLEVVFSKTFSRSYYQRFNNINKEIISSEENPKGAYLRVLFRNLE